MTGSSDRRSPGRCATRKAGTKRSTSSIRLSMINSTRAMPSRSSGNFCGQDVAGGGHLGGNGHRIVRKEAAVVVLVRHHLDALVDLQALEDLARLAAEFVAQEDVAAVVPVEAVLARSRASSRRPTRSFRPAAPAGPPWASAVAHVKPGRAGADHDDVVALVGHWRPRDRVGSGKKNGVRSRYAS